MKEMAEVQSQEACTPSSPTPNGSVSSCASREDGVAVPGFRPVGPVVQNSLLLRLFQSNHCDPAMTVGYLFKTTEPGVLQYLANKLFAFSDYEVDVYLPQLMHMYIHQEEVAEAIHPYITHRCCHGIIFSLRVSWLIICTLTDLQVSSSARNRGVRLHFQIASEALRPGFGPNGRVRVEPDDPQLPHSASSTPRTSSVSHGARYGKHRDVPHVSSLRKDAGHRRSKSDVPLSQLDMSNSVPPKGMPHVSSVIQAFCPSSSSPLSTGHAFSNMCRCVLDDGVTSVSGPVRGIANSVLPPACHCGANRLSPVQDFVSSLEEIGRKLPPLDQKDIQIAQLKAEISQINLNLPARIPLIIHNDRHQIARIPHSEVILLNSRTKAPFFLHVEVLTCEDTFLSPLVPRLLDNAAVPKPVVSTISTPALHSSAQLPAMQNTPSRPANPTTTAAVVFSMSDSPDINGTGRGMEAAPAPESLDDCFSPMDVYERLKESHKNRRRQYTDASVALLKEPWSEKVQRIRKSSPYGHYPNWMLVPVIVKVGDDLRQESLACQLIAEFHSVWKKENLPLWLRPYQVLPTSIDGGMIEPICNAVSLHQINQQRKGLESLMQYFLKEFGEVTSESFLTAQQNFVESSAAYCLVCYLLQVKDRHNGNILLDDKGHIIHIDFGFILNHSPGGNLGFESSPFKMTTNMIEVMGGSESDMYRYFRMLLLKGLVASRKHIDRFMTMVEIMNENSHMPCFGRGGNGVRQMRERFCQGLTDEQLELHVDTLLSQSIHSMSTKLYDGFQYLTNGIM